MPDIDDITDPNGQMDRRSFLSASSLLMAGGLASSYGTFAYFSGQFLYPSEDLPKGWMFVCEVRNLKKNMSLNYTAPNGAKLVITRFDDQGTAADFRALSSVCPHLGCQVHWESQNSRFFCPCHNGAFDASGRPTEGPPAAANQTLPEYPLKVEDDLLFVEIPLVSMASARAHSHERQV